MNQSDQPDQPDQPTPSADLWSNPPEPPAKPCTSQVCLAGHTWPSRMAAPKCAGCNQDILAVKRELCPVCNEPARAIRFRMVVAPHKAYLAKRCQGETNSALIDLEVEVAVDGEALAGYPVEGGEIKA